MQATGSAAAGLLLWWALSGIVSDPVSRLEGILSDFRNQAWMVFYGPTPEDQPSPVTVVDVDERTLQELGLYGESYRRHHAKVVENLSRDGAAAVVFDVLFKESSASRTQLAEIEVALRKAGIPGPGDSIQRERLRRAVDVSTLLEEAVARSGRTIVAAQLGDHLEYPNPSDWIPLVRRQWQESVWNTGLRLPPAALRTLRGRNTLDNIYPALARGAERLALANIEPDVDGSVRRIQMLWRFPDTSFRDPVLAPEGTAQPMAYPSLSLATTMAMFGRRSEEAVYVPGKWIDLGVPLRVWKDSSGAMKVSAPELTWPMLEDLRSRRSDLDSLRRSRSGTLPISGEIVFHRRGDRRFSVALSYPDSLDDPMVRALSPMGGDTTWWNELPPDGSPAALSDLVMVRRDEEGFHLATLKAPGDLENPPRLEVTVTVRQMRILAEGLQELASRSASLDSLPVPTRIAFSNALDVYWDRTRRRFASVFLALRGSSIEDLLSMDSSRIAALRPGDTLEFGDPVRVPVDPRGSALLSFSAPARWVSRRTDESWVRHVSYVDVLNGRLDPGLVPGRVFVLGSSAIALADFVDTPIEQRHPGVNVQALGIHLWSSGDVLRLLPPWAEAVAPVGMALAAGTAAAFLVPAWSLLGTFALLLAWFSGTVVLFQHGWWAPLLGVFAPVFLTTVLMAALRYVLEEREKKFLHRSFSSYLSPHLIEQMIDSGDLPKLGGEEREITAFFSDIQAFSTFSEAIGSPARLVELLNEYLNALTYILESNGGMLDKYIGDAIVGMYGAPLRLEDHARRAVETAVAMQERLAILRSGWQNQGEAWPEIVHHMRTRIGLNTGLAVTGNMGSHLRMNYTMMGDTVNLAARLESGAKHYGAFVLATDSTVRNAGTGFLFRELDSVRVVGRNEPVLIHEVVGRSGDSRWDSCLEHFARGRSLYLSGDFAAARDAFRTSASHEPLRGQPGVKHTPSDVFLERCEVYIARPPHAWDGIHTATEK
jgi:class 3 adenylate cyclase/CHASE2 domain-containing sensor protein